MEGWRSVATAYEPLKCGSIDGTDTLPHDKAVVRAMNAKCEWHSDCNRNLRLSVVLSGRQAE